MMQQVKPPARFLQPWQVEIATGIKPPRYQSAERWGCTIKLRISSTEVRYIKQKAPRL